MQRPKTGEMVAPRAYLFILGGQAGREGDAACAQRLKADLVACAAVRGAAGPEVPPMLDTDHWYNRIEALELGRGLEKLGYYWLEECMDEPSRLSYKWLAD